MTASRDPEAAKLEESDRVWEILGRIRRAMADEYADAERREKAEPECRYREGIAEGVCDTMNRVNSIIDRALRKATALGAANTPEQQGDGG